MNSSYVNRSIEILSEEDRVIRRVKSSDADAFAQLYHVCVEQTPQNQDCPHKITVFHNMFELQAMCDVMACNF